MGSIYLIRHGQASFGADDYDVLSPVGVEQAQVLGRHLADMGLVFDRCVAGDLRRQQHTATAAFDQYHALGLPVPALETDSAFNEFDAEAIIRALLPDLLSTEPEALEILRNAAQNRRLPRRADLVVEQRAAGAFVFADGLRRGSVHYDARWRATSLRPPIRRRNSSCDGITRALFAMTSRMCTSRFSVSSSGRISAAG